jgi:hypothetical protein
MSAKLHKLSQKVEKAVLAGVGEKGMTLVQAIGTALADAESSHKLIAAHVLALREMCKNKEGKPDYAGRTSEYREAWDAAITLAYGNVKEKERKRITAGVAYHVNKALVAKGVKDAPTPPVPQSTSDRLMSAVKNTDVNETAKSKNVLVPMRDGIDAAIAIVNNVTARIDGGETFTMDEVKPALDELTAAVAELTEAVTEGPREVPSDEEIAAAEAEAEAEAV